MKASELNLLSTIALLSCANLLFATKPSVYPEGFKPKTTTGTSAEQSPISIGRSISFTENKGQVHDQNYQPRPDVLFGAMTGNMAFHLKTNGVSYQLTKTDSYKEVEDLKTKKKRKEIDQQTIYRIDLSWMNANNNFTMSTDETLGGYNNYYLENCPDGALDVKSFTGVTAHNLYNGINLHYYEKEGQLKHDYIVAPGANYKQIQLRVDGAKVSLNKDGSLLLITPLGKIQEGAPIVFQNGNQLKAKWKIDKNILSFDIENYNSNKELIIDPVTRLWGSYYGGNGTDNGYCTVTDAAGNVYVTGYTDTNTSTLIATAGAHQTVNNGGGEAFLVQFNSSGVRQWGTYYGGAGADQGNSCVADAIGNIYMAGYTTSTTNIATGGAHQTVNGGGNDAFLVKFNSSGIRQWGTYYGGTGIDRGISCTSDATGNVYMAGHSTSYAILATVGAHQTANGVTADDAFLVKFNSSGVRQWGTYYGGSGVDQGRSCATDGNGNIYMAGYTTSTTNIATGGAHQTVNGGGTNDAFLVKFNSSGIRQWGNYYGGTGNDGGYSCATDGTGNIYLSGWTSSNTGTIIATVGSHQSTYGGGSGDAFLVKFNSSGIRQWGTYYGGSGTDNGFSCATDGTSNVYMSGNTFSNIGTVMATAGSYQPAFGGGTHDDYLVQFNSNGVRKLGTYYGGTGFEDGGSCATDAAGNVYMTGWTNSNTGTAIASLGSHKLTYGGGTYDAFLVKFYSCSPPTNATGIDVNICANNSAALTATSAGANINWYGSPTSTLVLSTGTVYTTPILSVGNYTYYAEAFTCTTSIARTAISVNVNANPTVTVNSGTICSGNNFTINPSGANTYTIQGGNAVVNPTANASFTVVGKDVNGCISPNVATSNVTVNANPTITLASNMSLTCVGESVTLSANGALSYTFNTGGIGSSIVVSPIITTNYTVTGTDVNGCQNSAVITQNVDACTGLAQVKLTEGQLLICPNPFSNKITIETKAFNKIILLYNVLGETVRVINLENEKTEIDLSELTTGVYFIKTELNIVKIIKQ